MLIILPFYIFISLLIYMNLTMNYLVLRAMFCCGDSTMSRGEDLQLWQFADMFILPYDEHKNIVGPCPFTPLYTVRNEGKIAPRTEHLEYQAFVQDKDPPICPMGSLALYLFRWQFLGTREAAPDVTKGKREW